MSTEQLPDGPHLAVKLLAQIGDDDSDRAIAAVHDLADERAQRVTQQHHAADLAQRVADLEAERDELRARLAEIEAQEPVMYVLRSAASRPQPPVVTHQRYLSVAISDRVDEGLDHLDPLYARPVTAQAVPDGWRLAPVEPTPDMLDAARSQSSFPLGVYRAMIAAAPEHKSTGCGACGDACAKRGSCRLADESPEAV